MTSKVEDKEQPTLLHITGGVYNLLGKSSGNFL